MPAKITVRAELASLLAKSQELTDANRQSQLKKEADRREDQKRLKAKKANEDAARRKPLEDPVGRNIFTAATGQSIISAWRVFVYQSPTLTNGGENTMTVWSGNGLQSGSLSIPFREKSALVPWDWVDEYEEDGIIYHPAGLSPSYVEDILNGGPGSISNAQYSPSGYTLNTIEPSISGAKYDVLDNGLSADYAVNLFRYVLPVRLGVTVVILGYDNLSSLYLETSDNASGTIVWYDLKESLLGQAAFLVTETSVRSIPVPDLIANRVSQYELPETPPPYPYGYPLFGTGDEGFGDAHRWLIEDAGKPLLRLSDPSQFLWLGPTNAEQLYESSYDPQDALTYGLLPPNVRNFKPTAFYDNSALYPEVIESERRAAVWTGAFPWPETSVSISDPRWGSRAVRMPPPVAIPRQGADPMLVWDWGKSSYCLEQLLALGFTAADLVP